MNKNYIYLVFAASIIVGASIIGAITLLIKDDRKIDINCIGKTRYEILKLQENFPRVEINGKMMIVIGNLEGNMYFEDINQIESDEYVMSLPNWEVFKSCMNFSLFGGWKYLVVKFNSEGIVIDQEVRYYFDGP